MESKYKWISPGLAKGVAPDAAIEELERIEKEFGILTPENVLKASEAEDAILHKLFQWDNETAAYQYRLQQARNILNNVEIRVISDGGHRYVGTFENIKTVSGRAYKHVEKFTEDDIDEVRIDCIKALNYWKGKLNVYKDFSKAAKLIDKAMVALDK